MVTSYQILDFSLRFFRPDLLCVASIPLLSKSILLESILSKVEPNTYLLITKIYFTNSANSKSKYVILKPNIRFSQKKKTKHTIVLLKKNSINLHTIYNCRIPD